MQDFNFYENTLAFSVSDKDEEKGIENDLLIKGNTNRLSSALAIKMIDSKELESFMSTVYLKFFRLKMEELVL